jgi:hypothetical protein
MASGQKDDLQLEQDAKGIKGQDSSVVILVVVVAKEI